jgi:hypothetical protein
MSNLPETTEALRFEAALLVQRHGQDSKRVIADRAIAYASEGTYQHHLAKLAVLSDLVMELAAKSTPSLVLPDDVSASALARAYPLTFLALGPQRFATLEREYHAAANPLLSQLIETTSGKGYFADIARFDELYAMVASTPRMPPLHLSDILILPEEQLMSTRIMRQPAMGWIATRNDPPKAVLDLYPQLQHADHVQMTRQPLRISVTAVAGVEVEFLEELKTPITIEALLERFNERADAWSPLDMLITAINREAIVRPDEA